MGDGKPAVLAVIKLNSSTGDASTESVQGLRMKDPSGLVSGLS
jgi:hypothetical protein